MAKITIGEKEYTVPEMNFLALERAWPYIDEALGTVDPIKGVRASIAVIAAGLLEAEDYSPLNYDIDLPTDSAEEFSKLQRFLKKRLMAREVGAIKLGLFAILEEAGIEIATKGEPLTPEEKVVESLLTGTALDLSLNSSPPELKEEAGLQSESTGDSTGTD